MENLNKEKNQEQMKEIFENLTVQNKNTMLLIARAIEVAQEKGEK